jgi:hypothetical protein
MKLKKFTAKFATWRYSAPIALAVTLINSYRLDFFHARRASTSALFGYYSGFPGRNGDHMYYTSMALQFSGKTLSQAIHTATRIFPDYPNKPSALLYGFLDPSVAPLIYPRQVLTRVLSWGYTLFGAKGLGLSTLLLGITTLTLLVRWSWREWGATAGFITLLATLGSSSFIWYGTGIFIEAPLMLIEVLWLYSLPISRHYRPHKLWYPINALLIFLMGFTRQSPLLPCAILFGGWLATFLKSKKRRNAWTPILLFGTTTALATYLLTAWWAPYSPSSFKSAPHPSLSGSVHYLVTLAKIDPIILFTFGITIYAGRTIKNRALAWVSLGVAIASIINIFITTGEYRYWAPLFIFTILISSWFIAHKAKAIDKSQPKKRRRSPRRSLIALSFLTAILTYSTIHFYSEHDGLVVEKVAVDQIFPDTTLAGTIECRGTSARLYWTQPQRSPIALDGTAMSAHPGISNSLNRPAKSLAYDRLQNVLDGCTH